MLLELPPRRNQWPGVLRAAMLVWTLFGLACTAIALWSMRTHGHAPWRIATYEVLVWNGWTAATFAVIWLGRRWPLLPFSWRAAVAHVGAALVLGLIHHAWWAMMVVVVRPFDAMGAQSLWSALRDDVADRMFLEGLVYFAVLGVSYAVDYQRRLRERELRAAQLEASLAHARLTALELQLQPHFLFNTLHTIGGLVRQSRGAEAIEMIACLSDLLRYSLDHAGKHLVALEHELAIVRRYLDIQVRRFSDRLTVEIAAASDTAFVPVPALLLQPLVENAIRHGVERVNGPAKIVLRAHREGDTLVLVIENTAPGAMQSSEGVGIANTHARLQQLFPDRYTFALANERDCVVTTLRLPAEQGAA
jgi:two-component system, LytTR family, sensor kinase